MTDSAEKLKKLCDILEHASDLLNLEEGWDEEFAKPINFESHIQAMGLIHLVMNEVVPEVNPCRDSTIDLSWRGESVKLLVNVNGDQVAYYGDSQAGYIKSGRIPIEQAIPDLKTFIKRNL